MEMNLILHLVPLIVGTDLLAHPELTGEALEGRIDGDLRHAVRVALGGAGFLADLLWSYAPLHDQIRRAIGNEVARASAQRGPAVASEGGPATGATPPVGAEAASGPAPPETVGAAAPPVSIVMPQQPTSGTAAEAGAPA